MYCNSSKKLIKGEIIVKKKIDLTQLSPEELEAEKLRRRKKMKRRKIMTVCDRVFGFFLATGIVAAIAVLALGMIICRGPSQGLKETFVMTLLETRRFDFVPHIFLHQDEIHEMYLASKGDKEAVMDSSLINIPTEENKDQTEDYGLVDEDGDGIIYEQIKGAGFAGHMLIVLDPSRVFVGMPEAYGYGASGMTLDAYCEKYGAVGGINAGGFLDDAGAGLGGFPDGLTVIDSVIQQGDGGGNCFVGLDKNDILWVGYYTEADVEPMQIRDGVTFGPILISNGVMGDESKLLSGVNPRTAIGQRADGAILMLVVDGRQAHSIGATYLDMAEVMMSYGAVNAINLDGGSSTVMWYNGDFLNSCSSANGISRSLPNAFLIKPLEK